MFGSFRPSLLNFSCFFADRSISRIISKFSFYCHVFEYTHAHTRVVPRRKRHSLAHAQWVGDEREKERRAVWHAHQSLSLPLSARRRCERSAFASSSPPSVRFWAAAAAGDASAIVVSPPLLALTLALAPVLVAVDDPAALPSAAATATDAARVMVMTRVLPGPARVS